MRCSSAELLKLLDQLQLTMTRWQAPLLAHCQLSSGCIRSIRSDRRCNIDTIRPFQRGAEFSQFFRNLTRFEVFCAVWLDIESLQCTQMANSIATSLKLHWNPENRFCWGSLPIDDWNASTQCSTWLLVTFRCLEEPWLVFFIDLDRPCCTS